MYQYQSYQPFQSYQTWPPSPMMEAPASHKPDTKSHIEVTGEGSVAAAPDQAIIVLGAVTENTNLQTAQNENAAAISNIVAALLQLNIPKEQIQTVQYRIETRYDFEDGKQIFRGYEVTHLLQVKTDKTEEVGLIVDTAVSNGANSVTSIQFTMKNPDIHYNQALAAAVKNAQQKAMLIARTVGVTLISPPVLIEEESRSLEPPPVPLQATMFAKVAATPIQPGQLTVRAVVRAQFAY